MDPTSKEWQECFDEVPESKEDEHYDSLDDFCRTLMDRIGDVR